MRCGRGTGAILAGLLLLVGLACKEADLAQPEARASNGKLRFKNAAGELLVELKPKEGGYKLYDAGGRVVGKARLKNDRVTFRDSDDREIWKLKKKANGLEIEDPEGNLVSLVQM